MKRFFIALFFFVLVGFAWAVPERYQVILNFSGLSPNTSYWCVWFSFPIDDRDALVESPYELFTSDSAGCINRVLIPTSVSYDGVPHYFGALAYNEDYSDYGAGDIPEFDFSASRSCVNYYGGISVYIEVVPLSAGSNSADDLIERLKVIVGILLFIGLLIGAGWFKK